MKAYYTSFTVRVHVKMNDNRIILTSFAVVPLSKRTTKVPDSPLPLPENTPLAGSPPFITLQHLHEEPEHLQPSQQPCIPAQHYNGLSWDVPSMHEAQL